MLISLLLLILLAIGGSHASGDIPTDIVRFGVSSLEHNNKNYYAVLFKNFEGWHTYWKNPGDAGQPLMVSFFIDGEKKELAALEWPTPKRYIEEGNMLAYGYSGEYALFYDMGDINAKKIVIKLRWLVCKHICIPGKGEITGSLTNGKFSAQSKTTLIFSRDKLITHLEKIPVNAPAPEKLNIYLSKDIKEKKLNLYFHLPSANLTNIRKDLNVLTPFLKMPFNFKREELFFLKNDLYGRIPIEWDGEYQDPPLDLPGNGKFAQKTVMKFLFFNPETKKVSVITKDLDSFSIGDAVSSDKFYKGLKPLAAYSSSATGPTAATSSNNIFFYLLLALIGGLILNFMPCVLPIISLKLFGLLQQRDSSNKSILLHNIFYSLGVIFTFLILGVVIILLQKGGEEVGWGFQLQSPRFVASMILLLFIFTLNLFELFEFGTPGGKFLSNYKLNSNYMGDFLSGILTTILATPCSAPFLGTALTFAFASTPLTILVIFFFIGLGLALPFLITGMFPRLINLLPRPGVWMVHLKKFLGLALIFTIIWLYDLFLTLVTSTEASALLNIVLALSFFIFYMRKNITKRKLVVIPLLIIMHVFIIKLFKYNSSTVPVTTAKTAHSINWEKWSPDKLVQHKKAQNIVFIDFTAKWCFTCKVNERLVLDTAGFEELVAKHNLKLLLADWTKRDVVIGRWLKEHNYVGVPAYFIQTAEGKLIDLGETISLGEISDAIKN